MDVNSVCTEYSTHGSCAGDVLAIAILGKSTKTVHLQQHCSVEDINEVLKRLARSSTLQYF